MDLTLNDLSSIVLSQPDKEVLYMENYSENPVVYPAVITQYLDNVNIIGMTDLYNVLQRSYMVILDMKFVDQNKHTIAKAFLNERFVQVFSQVINAVSNKLTQDQIVVCNKLIYDYITSSEAKKQQSITNMLYNIGFVINMRPVSELIGLGVDQTTATRLAVSRYSTGKEDLAIKRVNVDIVNSQASLMTEQMIVNIYCKLFSHVASMFDGIIYDKWDESLLQSEEQEEIYSLINLAILDILNEMTLEQIMQVLSLFTQTRNYLHSSDPLRFSIYAISQSDYGRILQAIDILREQRGIVVPRY